jgi:DNA repair photolyase
MQIKKIDTQKVLSPTNITLADYVINPYRGCSFGCLYCYSQENKNIDQDEFYDTLGVKENAPQILERELRFTKPKRILLGSTTECFQAQELNLQITRQILKILNKHNIPYTILTKSHLIKEYLLLISENKDNKIYFTLNCAQDSTIRLLERKSPNLSQRLDTIKAILESNIQLRIHAGPFIPYISDLSEILKILPNGITEMDIELYHHRMGRFKDILNILEPKIKERLEKIYSSSSSYETYAKQLKNDIKGLQKKYPDINFFYIVPDFNQYYSSTINYEQAIF